MIEDVFARKALNFLYLNISEIVPKLPFSGRYWLEEISKGMAFRILNEYGSKEMFQNKEPLEVCRTYIKLLEDLNFISSAREYPIENSSSGGLTINLKRDTCIYREFCIEAEEKELFFKCPRITSLEAALEWGSGEKYSSVMETDREHGICHGRVSPQQKAMDEIVTREDHILKIAGRRAVLLPKITYSSILEAIKNYAPHILKHVLYDAGYKSALPIAEKAKTMYPDPWEYLTILFEELKNAGLGKVILESLDTSICKAVIRCYDSFQIPTEEFETSLYRTPRVICDLLRGTFAAYLSVYFQKKIFCEEMRCQSVNGEFCEFVSFPLDEENGVGGSSFDPKGHIGKHHQNRNTGLFSG